MHITPYALLLLGAATGLMAAPSTSANEVETGRVQTKDGGWIIFYGEKSGAKRDVEEIGLVKRAEFCNSQNRVRKCGTKKKYNGPNDFCNKVVQQAQDNGNIAVPTGSQKMCYSGANKDDRNCCLAWSKVVYNIKQADLFAPGWEILQNCNSDGISGKIFNQQLGSSCVNFCLSRHDSCSNNKVSDWDG